MNTPEKDDIHTLLRLKKHEQPPPQYFENFLAEFQRRQRGEMLRRSVWQLAWDRVQAFFETDRAGAFRYAAATAAVLVAATITAVNILAPTGAAPMARTGSPVKHLATTQATQNSALTLDMRPAQLSAAPKFSTAQPGSSLDTLQYVIDARPVSYEPPSGL